MPRAGDERGSSLRYGCCRLLKSLIIVESSELRYNILNWRHPIRLVLSKMSLFSIEIETIQCGTFLPEKKQKDRLYIIYKVKNGEGGLCLLVEACLITSRSGLDWTDEEFLPATVTRRESQIIKKVSFQDHYRLGSSSSRLNDEINHHRKE
jgi:hypothetical protein